jgi:7-cyano-7-deazaguanine synthase
MEALVLLSGGIDSTVLLHYAKKSFKDVEGLYFKYGSKHSSKEFDCAVSNCEKLNIDLGVICLDLAMMGVESALLKNGEDIPEGHYADKKMESTVVPFRNGIMLSHAAAYAMSAGFNPILIGCNKDDWGIYSDCRISFLAKMNSAIYKGTNKKVKVMAPFSSKHKSQIVRAGIDLGVDFEKTWSCYNGQEKPCLKCGPCVARTEVFLRLGLIDPLIKTEEEWQSAVSFYESVRK